MRDTTIATRGISGGPGFDHPIGRIRLPHLRFLEGGEQGAGGSQSQEPNSASSGEGDDSEASGGRTFSQEELDRIIAGRLKKYSDYDSIKQELQDLRDATATEQEKAVEAARREGADEATKHADERLKRAESRGLAAELGFVDPGEAHLFLDLSEIQMVDGDVDVKGLRKALEAVADKRPYLVKKTGTAHDAGIGVAGKRPEPKPGLDRLEAAFDAALTK